MSTRILGRSGVEVSALGLGGWAIGGTDWGQVDDNESIRAIHRALELGVRFFDTADAYGAGHSERVLGRALAGRRAQVAIATKFGVAYDDGARRALAGSDPWPAYARSACEASLQRLNTDYIDLFQLHVGDQSHADSLTIRDTLEELVEAGKIRAYGWSTDNIGDAELFAAGPHCTAIQHRLNVLDDAPDMLTTCEVYDLASIDRSPLAKGILTGKFTTESRLPADDVRGKNLAWLSDFVDGRPNPATLAKVEAVREILHSDGRTAAQGALAWIWGRSDRTIPIPGFKSVAQVEDNAGALAFGPLTSGQMAEIDAILRAAA
jgi:aryl-alcohol dehydrogenase-like predicted oxidoreductase